MQRSDYQISSHQLPGFAPGEMRVRLWTGSTEEARRQFAIEGRSTDGKWCARAFLDVDRERQLAITRLEMWPDDTDVVTGAKPQTGLSGDALRHLPLGRWMVEALAQLTDEDLLAKTGAGYDPMLKELGYENASADRKEWARRVSEEARSIPLRRRGRRGYPDDHYRRIALAYLELQRQGVSRGIQQQLAEQEGRPWQTIRDWVRIATEKGFLGPGSKGKAGRMPGPNLYDDGSSDGGER